MSDAFQMRTRQTHANHCADLGGPLHDHYATTYGLHRDSCLNTLTYFHVTEGLVPDVMHDCLEGCVQLEVKQLLKSFISRRLLSIPTLNNLLQSFPYLGPDARNRPSIITEVTLASADHSLKQSGEYMISSYNYICTIQCICITACSTPLFMFLFDFGASYMNVFLWAVKYSSHSYLYISHTDVVLS